MKISFVAGFGPVVPDPPASRAFYGRDLGVVLEEAAPGYFATDDLDGVRAFALWPLSQAAELCFGTGAWPAELPVPQAWIEFDLESAAAVGEAADELASAGHRLIRTAGPEPWGQIVARLQSPEGLLVGLTFTPWMHEGRRGDGPDGQVGV